MFLLVISGVVVMCGIVGLFLKNHDHWPGLGRQLDAMLIEMTERGPDSAGFAVFGDPTPADTVRITVLALEPDVDWSTLVDGLAQGVGCPVAHEVIADHATLTAPIRLETLTSWLAENRPDVLVVSGGTRMQLFKGVGRPADVALRYRLAERAGSHAIGHTRMATESAVTSRHCHPYWSGRDICLVHNGSLSNHNRERRRLEAEGIQFQSDNDSEVAAAFIASRLNRGESLQQALEASFSALDGFYTFLVGTADGLAIARDGIACKPAVLGETDDWVAVASEHRALAGLPGVENAEIWEPKPATVYSWRLETMVRAA